MRRSAGVLVYREKDSLLEVFLVHPGGPFWRGKDLGAWSIPKGEFSPDEDPLEAATREFREETGQEVTGTFLPLQPITQKAGKQVFAWAVRGNPSADNIVSNTFRMEYPYRSGNWITIPEVDKAGWFTLEIAREKINPAQVALLDNLVMMLTDEKSV
jgi:predicted NUDIX family NTP pyrophosphohydrolase